MLARIRKAMDEKDEGFTLIELLVVIIIIGILAAIAIPVFLNQRKKGYDAQSKSDLKNAATAMETYFSDQNTYPVSGLASKQLGSTTAPNNLGWRQSLNTSDTDIRTSGTGGAAVYKLATLSDSGQGWCYDSAQSKSGVYKGNTATSVTAVTC